MGGQEPALLEPCHPGAATADVPFIRNSPWRGRGEGSSVSTADTLWFLRSHGPHTPSWGWNTGLSDPKPTFLSRGPGSGREREPRPRVATCGS